MEVLYGAVDGVVVERCPPEELADSAVTGDLGARRVVFVCEDHDALDVGK